jgi:uncharacterized delta-60 repeat protein
MPNTIYNPLTGNFDYVIDDAAEIAYTPADPADWPVAPDDTKEALDSLANTVASLSVGAAPDATTTTKGIVKLAGDLGGTADVPTVPDMVKSVSNVGGGEGVFYQKDGYDIELKSITGSGSVSVTTVGTEISILGSGEANTASNVGGANGVFKEKVGTDLQFKSLVAGTGITITPVGDTLDISSVAAAGVTIKDEGTPIVPTVTNINFVGDGVNTTTDGVGGAIVTIPGGGGSTPNVYPILDAQTNTLLETINGRDKTYDITYSVNRSVLPDTAINFSSEFQSYPYFGGTITASAFQSDQKLLVGSGASPSSGGIYGTGKLLARLNTDGSLDTSFMNNISTFSQGVSCIAIQSDGKILVGGAFLSYNGTGKSYLIRLNTDGTEDTLFSAAAVVNGTTARFNGTVRSIAVQSDGKILVGGSFTNYNSATANGKDRLIRLNTDGTEDTVFTTAAVANGTTARFNGAVNSISVSASTIVVGGDFTTYNTLAGRSYLAKFSLTGGYDTIFGGNAVYSGTTARFSAPVNSVFVQSDGKILVGGEFTAYAGVGNYNGMVRLNSTGTLDSAFLSNTISYMGFSSAFSVSFVSQIPDGRVLICGNILGGNNQPAGIRVTLDDGSKDTTFWDNALMGADPDPVFGYGKIYFYSTTLTVNTAAYNPVSGDLFFGGAFFGNQTPGKLFQNGIHVTSTGLTTNFFKPSIFTTYSSTEYYLGVTKQTDGKFLVYGNFMSFKNSGAIRTLIRFNSDLSIDTAFMQNAVYNTPAGQNYTSKFSNAGIKTCIVQPDGKILIGGTFSNYNINSGKRHLLRFNSDGTEDTTFSGNAVVTGTTQKFNSQVDALALQPDGKILVGGNFTNYQGTGKDRLIRLNADGTEDTLFSAAAVVNGTTPKFSAQVKEVIVQSDGKILVGGNFTSYNSPTANGKNCLIRLNTDGTEDTAFTTNAVASGTTARFNAAISSIALQSDGKILVGGGFTAYGGTGRDRLIRLNTDGTADGGFITNASVTGTTPKFNGAIQSIAVQKSGKIAVTGDFTSYNVQAGKNYLIRLNSDGTEDTVFNARFVISGTSPRLSFLPNSPSRRVQAIDSSLFYSGVGFYSSYDASVGMGGLIQFEEEIRSEIGTLLAKYNSTGYSYSTPNKIGSSAETGVTMSFNSDGTIKYTSTTLGNSPYAVDEIKIEKKEY